MIRLKSDIPKAVVSSLVKNKVGQGVCGAVKHGTPTGNYEIDVPYAFNEFFNGRHLGTAVGRANVDYWNKIYKWSHGENKNRVFSCIDLNTLDVSKIEMADVLCRLINMWAYIWPYTGEVIEDTLLNSSDLTHGVAAYEYSRDKPVLFIWYPTTKLQTIIGLK